MEQAPQGSIPPSGQPRKRFIGAALRKFQRVVQAKGENPPELLPSGEFVGEKRHGHQLLTNVEEKILVGQILARHQQGVVFTRKGIQEIAKLCFPSRGKFGQQWAAGFLRRNDEGLGETLPKSMSVGRKAAETFKQTLTFCEVFSKLLEELEKAGKPVSVDTLVNVDETLIEEGPTGKIAFQVVPKREKMGGERVNTQVIGSLLTFVTAGGYVPVVLVCNKGEPAKKNGNLAAAHPIINIPTSRYFRNSKSPCVGQVHHVTSPSGYMSEEHVKKGLELFGIWAQVNNQRSTVLLLWDNLPQHRSHNVLTQCENLGVLSQMLPPNSSHFLQPLNNLVFATLQRNSPLMGSAVATAFQTAFTPAIIRSSWENVGLWPFSPEVIKERAREDTGGGEVKKNLDGKGGGWGVDSVQQMVIKISNESFRRERERRKKDQD